MVYIKKVEIYGFKSFGFTNKVINLEEGLVCITGPNGSGKSNILDAIAFALGENSPKTLRVDRLHSLLHDNANDSRRKRVRVSVTFDNIDRGIPMDSNTVTITREMPLDGDSIYLLNGKHVSKSTITDLLEVAFASPNKLNNVQQGMIMRIAELNAEERRKILEDIIGLSYFDKKKEEAMKQLSEADRKLEVALARMGEIRKRIDELELERNNQMRFHYLEKEIKKLNAIRISNTIKRYRVRINELNKLIEEKSKEKEELSKEFDKVRMELEELERERGKIMQEVDKSTKNKAEINTKISNLIVRLEQLKATKNASEQRINVIGNAIPSLIKEKEELKQKISKLEVEIKRIEEEARSLDEKKNNINNNISKLNKNLDQLNKELSELNTKENRLNSALRDKEGLYTNIKSSLAEISERLKVLDEHINSNATKLENLSKEVNRLEDNLKQLEGIKDKRDKDLSNIKDDIERLTKMKSKLSQYIDEALDVLE
ncbi:MAG: chromosome segregation protein SMC, partial [Candidatus Nitrosothermus koennekii]